MTEPRPDGGTPREPPAPLRVIGQGLTRLVARWPTLWPLVRGPVRRFFDRLAGGWDERVLPDAPEHLAALNAALDRLERVPQRILDLGTGTGAAALMLARRFERARVAGVDISEVMIEAARAKVEPALADRVEFRVADAAALPYPDSSFDLVVQISAPVFFDEIARVLEPGGHAVVVSSLGEATPFHTPEPLLRRGFERRGLTVVDSAGAGRGLYWVARLVRARPAASVVGDPDSQETNDERA